MLAASFLERNSWVPGVVVAVVLFLIGTGITLYLRRRDKDSKHLDYQILSDTPILTRRDHPGILKVVVGSKVVSNPYITEVRFKNTGKQVIEADDFLGRISIQRSNAKVLTFNLVGESARNLIDYADLTFESSDEENPVQLKPLTLNSGDWFTVQMIYDSESTVAETISVTGRIKGQTRPPRLYQDREPMSSVNKTLLSTSGILSLILLILGLYAMSQPESVKAASSATTLGLALLTAGGVFWGVALNILWSHRLRKAN
ncbi:hypothetical protein A5676_18335 [Mycobacterium malmoense]|uniref:hypothetical protein n=1 Tax=Mycobacterium malmoense TaxID=1780 RepID=UPI00080BA9A4|nr:hypothetical protein [Mycobacterium malmoense]OCB37264.1 hypothetical protein A5676_18335 [Mycobacterium malmoense]